MASASPENSGSRIIKGKIPLDRSGRPEEIAKAVLFLVADGNYITGQQINVNGGMFM